MKKKRADFLDPTKSKRCKQTFEQSERHLSATSRYQVEKRLLQNLLVADGMLIATAQRCGLHTLRRMARERGLIKVRDAGGLAMRELFGGEHD